ncbi:MAG: RNA polymerase sigma factor [Ilumatobacter sp.]
MTTTARELVARIDTDRAAFDTISAQFASWWSERHDEAPTLLDELAQRARHDRTSLELLLTLLDRHGIARPALHRTLVDPNDLDDAEQATLAVVGTRLNQFDGRSRFTTWLHTIAANEAKMLIRTRSRRPATPTEHFELSPFLARLSTMLADRDVIDRALAGLPDQYRRPIELREIDGLDYREIAATLQIGIGTVRSRLSRGRAMLLAATGEGAT